MASPLKLLSLGSPLGPCLQRRHYGRSVSAIGMVLSFECY